YLRTITFALPPLIIFVAFSVASVFSARTTTPAYSSNTVLIQPNDCGFIDLNQTMIQSTAPYRWQSQIIYSALNYARSCYQQSSTPTASCEIYPFKSLPYETNT